MLGAPMSQQTSRRRRHERTPDPQARARRAERHARLLDVGVLAVAVDLPIAEHADELIAAIGEHQVVVVAGETGSGKSTQLPKLCLAAGRGVDGIVGHTQPRRVAARSIASRLADELHVPLGDAVGFAVRFTDTVGPETLVKVMTDGILLAEIQRDPLLYRYDTLIIDEAHERSLNIDFLIGYLTQLLPRRPDLKLIITSATIDTTRFAEHFATSGAPAPIVTVSGRTYPVEIRYCPLGGDGDGSTEPTTTDQVQAIADALGEIERDGPGDVLVFLSGEREIHDTADVLRRRPAGRQPLDVVPMYARLSAAEQQKIFRSPPAGHRRVVLSTNVAETSLTVPGIRYVIDTGLARISRYSRRLKVQRLPIEPISQASADQRAGRCGRIGPGVAIRLYSAEDFAGRDEFTEPEILRTNLAAVILQMTAIGLGDVESFPFLEPPDRALIGDGFRLLDELGALHRPITRDATDVRSGRRLTEIGRQLARLPVDPRLGRMIVEADRLGCVREVLVIASALSIQDPRERPLDRQQLADESHKRFAVPGSDLLGIVALWDYIRARQRELSGNQFRRLCQREFLHYVRTREWQDLYSQLRQIAGQLGIRPSTTSAHPDHVHQAVLAGLLSHLGMRDGESREFRGARGSTFVIGRGSVLTRKPPRWVVAAELVETERLFARRVATVQPQWAERLAGDLAKHSYGEARWDAAAGRATTVESVSLFGLPIVSGRTVGLDRIDPALARQLFIRNVLVDPEPAPGDGPDADIRPARRPTDLTFLERNRQFARDVRALEERLRSHHLLDLDTIHDAYERRVPDDVTTVAAFDVWWKRTRGYRPDLLDLTAADLNDPRGAAIDLDAFPDRWPYGDVDVPLRYRFDPGNPLDGVAVDVGVAVINQLAAGAFDWHIPGFRPELLAALARSLPKALRRELIPLTDTVAAASALLGEPDGPLLDAFATALTRVSGAAVDAADFDPTTLSTHLRVHFVVRDGDGAVLDAGDDLAPLRHRLAGAARAEIAAAVPIAERRGIVTWDLGELPETVSAERGGHVVRGYPALVDDGDSVSLRVFSNPELQQRVMRAGVRRLLLLAALPSTAAAERSIPTAAALAAGVPLAELGEQSAIAAVDVILGKRPLPFTADAFAAIADAVGDRGDALAAAVLRHAVDAAGEARRARRTLAELGAPGFLASVADAARQLDRLTEGRFVVRAGAARIADVVRYLQALNHRLERLRHDVGSDRRRMLEVQPLEAAYTAYLTSLGSQPASSDAVELGWQLEELRVAVFAQRQGTRAATSPTRIRRQLDRLIAANH